MINFPKHFSGYNLGPLARQFRVYEVKYCEILLMYPAEHRTVDVYGQYCQVFALCEVYNVAHYSITSAFTRSKVILSIDSSGASATKS